MPELLTAAQMRAIEKTAIDSGAVTGLELMERAGHAVVAAILEEWPDLAATSHKALILCGRGNNGGDGYVVARLLKQRGWTVCVFHDGLPTSKTPDAKANYQRWLQIGRVRDLAHLNVDTYASDNLSTAIVVDALFGTGLTRPFDSYAGVRHVLNTWSSASSGEDLPRVVSVDLPSGLCADSGRFLSRSSGETPLDTPIRANLTVAFHTAKIGHLLGAGPMACGAIRVKSIGLDRWKLAKASPSISAVTTGGEIDLLHRASRKFTGGQKYSHGHALILSGPPGRGGAARLAARGALRIGAGLVTIACPSSALQENAARLDAIMLHSLRGDSDADALAEALEDVRINAVCIGPGLGLHRAKALVPVVLAARGPGSGSGAGGVVLDADALSAFADAPQALFDTLHENCILTPHGGEFARLFPDIAEKLGAPASKGPAYSRVDATREAAKRAGCIVLFKGPDTVIADPSGTCMINAAHYDRAAPWLATAGSGDVIAGFITGLLARGFDPMQAAATAAWLHVECARNFGPGLIAEDLPEELPKVLRALDH